MKNINKYIMAICITTTSFSNSSNELLENVVAIDFKNDKCNEFTETYLQKILRERKSSVVKNPFVDNESKTLKTCTEISFKSNDDGNLNIEDFNGQVSIHNFYKKFLSDHEVMVSEAVLANGMIYKFLKFNTESEDNLFKSLKSGSKLKDNIDSFLFFHELTHLSPRHSQKNKSDKYSELETTADLSGIIMVSLTSNLSIEETKDMLSDLTSFRKKIGIKTHLNERGFRNAKKNLNNIDFNELRKYDLNTEEGFKKIFRMVEQIAYDMQKLKDNEFEIKYKNRGKL